MKMLLIHAERMKYEPQRKAVKIVADIKKKEVELKNTLVAFCSFEKEDEKEPDAVAQNAAEEIESKFKEVKADNILVYPYAHLSSSLAAAPIAQKILIGIKRTLEKDHKVESAPFGYYKSFELKCIGHPLAESFKEIREVKVEKPKTMEQKKAVALKKSRIIAEELPENDHRRIGQQLELFSFQEAAPGMPFFHDNGIKLINLLIDFWKKEHIKAGYQEVRTPMILNKELWEISGHWDHYKDNMYFTKIDEQDFALKPMNCPGGILVFKTKNHSYKDLPIRVAELGLVHRHELSGVLSGLFRVRVFTQDDAHIYMRKDQIKDEIIGVIKLIDKFYKTFGFDYHVELSTRPESSIGTDEQWEDAEAGLRQALGAINMKYKLNPGDGAFYGPKIDFHVKDAMGRTWQCGTIQLDMTMPEQFDLNYIDEENKQRRVVMIHRTIMGSVERFLGILIEHYKGAFPIWLSPTQVAVLPISEKNIGYAEEIRNDLEARGVRVMLDKESNTLQYKIRNAQMQKVPYMIIVGGKEEEAKTVSVRSRDGKEERGVKLDDFIERVLGEVKSFK